MNSLLDVVIVSFAKNAECENITIQCLNSLLYSENNSKQMFNIIVVESNPNVKYDHISENIKTYQAPLPYGYNKFLNYGRKQGNSPWVALCNNDLKFEKNWFSNILKVSQIDSSILSFSPICPLTQPLNGIKLNSGNYQGYQIRRYVSGWCIVQKRLIYEKIGDLDDSFIHWCADNDYALTLFKNDIKHVLVTNSVVVHHNQVIGFTTKNTITNQNQLNSMTNGGLELLNKKYLGDKKNNFIFKKQDVINEVIKKNGFVNYLEIGTNDKSCFDNIICNNKKGIFTTSFNGDNVYKMTSDEFFHSYTGEKFDVVLIDGIHSEEQVDKDIENSLNNLAENGIIFLDDCNPPTELHAKERPFYDVPYNGQWNGLVYRSLMKIRFDRQDLNVESYDTEWGLAAIKKEKSNSLICDGKLSWDFFNENRNQILNFKSFEDFFNSNNVKSYKISLCMIVKNEAKIIKRCLDSVKPLIDYVFIVDTGSDDDTINVINDWLLQNKMDGKVISEPWKDFAYNRSFAMSELRKMKNIEYVFMIDADEILNFDKNTNIQKIKNNLVKDLYSIRCNYGKIQYLKNSITKNSKPFCYKGVLHEFIDCQNELFTNDIIEGIYNIPIQDSARNKSIDKYKKDVEVLENEIKIEKNKEMLSRYYFYLAQSYRDCNEKEKAMHWYKERVKSGGWIQEIYYSLYQIARLKEMLQYPEDEIIQSYMIAFESLPQRIEAIFGAVLFCRKVNRFNQAYILAKYAQTIPKVYEGLFVENWIYEFAIEDELSVCCYHVGKFKEGKELTQKLISKVPEEHKKRFIHNLDEYNKKLNHNGLNI